MTYRPPTGPATKSLASVKSNPLSKFALALYSSPGVEETSIDLQDRLGAKVNLLLWCVWLESMDIELSIDLLNQAEQAIFPLEKNIIGTLRRIRRGIKLNQIDTNESQKLYQLTKRLELLAELEEIELLWRLSEKRIDKTVSTEKGANVKIYLETVGDSEAGNAFILKCDQALSSKKSK